MPTLSDLSSVQQEVTILECTIHSSITGESRPFLANVDKANEIVKGFYKIHSCLAVRVDVRQGVDHLMNCIA